MQYNLSDIQAWVSEERGPSNKPAEDKSGNARAALLKTLGRQLDLERKMPQPNQLDVGSPERLTAEARQRRIGTLATTLGYQPAGREMLVELVRDKALEIAGVGPQIKLLASALGDSEGDRSEHKPSVSQSERKKRRELENTGRGFGFGFDP